MKKRMQRLNVGLIGCGAMGTLLAESIQREFRGQAQLSCLYDHHTANALRLQKTLRRGPRLAGLGTLLRNCDVVIEAASQEAVGDILKASGVAAQAVFVMSAGALLTREKELAAFRRRFAGKVIVPSGAIAGIDGLLAARESGLKQVTLITRKPPRGVREAPFFKRRPFPVLKAREERCVFRGTARRAVREFPQNVNVAAVLSLAGIGPAKTKVEIWTSTRYRKNRHEVRLRYREGTVEIKVENRPSPRNPKTSALAIHAATASLRKYFETLRLGT